MRFAVIEGGLGQAGAEASGSFRRQALDVEDIEAEARRRLKAIKLDEWRTREFVSGYPMPADIKHLALQIEFAAQALARLSPIPADFDSDVYWPQVW